MDPRQAARTVAAGRVAFGALMIVSPRPLVRRMGDGADVPGPAAWMARAFGIRDVVLGAGALVAIEAGGADAARWVRLGAIADSADATAAIVFGRELGAKGAATTLALAVPAATIGWWAADSLAG